MKITTRLKLGFGMLVLLMAVVSGAAILKFNQLQDDFRLVLKDRYPKAERLHDVNDLGNQIARSTRNMLLMTAPADIQKERATVEQLNKETTDTVAALDKLMSSEKDKAGMKAVTDARAAFVSVELHFLDLASAGKTEEARNLLL